MLDRDEGKPPTKPSELAKTKSASHDDTVAPSELVMRAVDGARRLLGLARQGDGGLHRQAPRVEEIQRRGLAR